jgi:hypothetical protein
MSDGESDYKIGPGRPPLHARFQKGQSGNPDGRSAKSLPVLLADALNETVVVCTAASPRTYASVSTIRPLATPSGNSRTNTLPMR